ncbi:MAG TPA: serine/threonine-protein kinase [Gemmatimonadaceae bacterium]
MTSLREELQAKLSGSYKLGRELSGGGMSRVFVAEDAALARTVVVKVLAPELAAGLNSERFKREILLAAQLQHPHIVPVLAAGVADELPYFVMPFVVGESLRNKLLPEAGLPINETVSILRDVAKALAFAHLQGVVHRDIKPDNVLLAGGSAVVTDFGIAKAITSSAVAAPGGTLTQVGTSLGTPAYMSPEQAAGDPNADARSDFYSFGVMAYEMICGKTPFHDRPTHQLIMAHIAEPPEPIERLVPSVPSPVAHVVMRCLSKNPADRPQSAREILEDLDDVDLSSTRTRSGPTVVATGSATGIGDERIDTGPHAYADGTVIVDSAGVRQAIKSRRFSNSAIIAAVAFVLLVAAGLFGKKLLNRGGASALDDRALAVLPFRVASADPSHHYLREGMVDLIAAKLSGEDLRALDPRMMLDAWRRAGGSESNELSRDASLDLARQLKAGKALLGDVVGTPNRLVLNVALIDVANGSQITRLSVEGPPDSLSSLVNQISTQLMTQTSGEAAARMANLSSTSLPALRAYLDGVARLRRQDARNAVLDFDRALKEDSTFALAGLGLRLASAWVGEGRLGEHGIQIAWREKARLSPRDQALLVALAGPRYPQRSSNLDVYRAREQYVAMAPDNAEAWYLVADHLFHYGSAMGIPDWEDRSLAGFKKAMELDSLYSPGYTHAMPLAPSMGDTAFLNRAVRLRSASDTASQWRILNDWYLAAQRGDAAAASKVFDGLSGTNGDIILVGIIRHTLFDGTGAQYSKTAMEKFVAAGPTEAARRDRARFAHDVMLGFGRPNEALRYLSLGRDSVQAVNTMIITVRDALMGEIPESAAQEAVKALAQIEARPEPPDSASRDVQRAAIRVMEPWRIMHGDTSQTRKSIQRLRSLIRNEKADPTSAELEVAFIEMLHADAAHSPQLKRAVERVDSLILAGDVAAAPSTGRLAQYAVFGARMFEKLGDLDRATAMAGRYAVWSTEAMPYLARQLREQGRLAAKAGNRKRAIRAYKHYLGMRAEAEPFAKPEVDAVRRELSSLSR